MMKNDLTGHHKEKILVTGATGFLGGWVTEILHLMGAADVRAGVRNWSSAARLGRFQIEMVPCDILDPEQIDKAMEGVQRVVHCAVGPREVTVDGTRTLLEAALRHNVQRFVHISTAEIYGQVSGEIDETYPYQYTGRAYGDMKIDAEKVCLEYHQRGLPVTILRPSIIYGPFGADWSTDIARRMASGNWRTFNEQGEGICNLVYAPDLVSAIWLALHEPRAIGESFNIRGEETITWNEYFRRFNSALSLPELAPTKLGEAQFKTLFISWAKSSAKFALAHFEKPIYAIYERFRTPRELMRKVEKILRTNPNTADLNLYNRKAIYNAQKAHDVLGYTPQYTLDEGLKLTAQWVKHLGITNL